MTVKISVLRKWAAALRLYESYRSRGPVHLLVGRQALHVDSLDPLGALVVAYTIDNHDLPLPRTPIEFNKILLSNEFIDWVGQPVLLAEATYDKLKDSSNVTLCLMAPFFRYQEMFRYDQKTFRYIAHHIENVNIPKRVPKKKVTKVPVV